PRRSYTGLPLTHTSWAQYSTEASVSLLAVISQKSAPVGKLKSWRVEELKSPWTRCDLSNSPTFQLLRRLAHNNCERDAQRADRIHVACGDHLHEYLPPGPLDLRDGSAVHVDVHLGRGRRRDEGERRRQDASTSEAGRLVREAQEVAADDLPGLTAIHDPLHKHRALSVDKPVVKQLHKHRERFTLQRVLAADQTQDGVRVAKIHQAGDVVPGSARRCQDHDITVAVGA